MATRIKEDLYDEATEDSGILKKSGLRDISPAKMQKAFAAEIANGTVWTAWTASLPDTTPQMTGWNAAMRRAGPLPERLFDAIRVRDPEAAH